MTICLWYFIFYLAVSFSFVCLFFVCFSVNMFVYIFVFHVVIFLFSCVFLWRCFFVSFFFSLSTYSFVLWVFFLPPFYLIENYKSNICFSCDYVLSVIVSLSRLQTSFSEQFVSLLAIPSIRMLSTQYFSSLISMVSYHNTEGAEHNIAS